MNILEKRIKEINKLIDAKKIPDRNLSYFNKRINLYKRLINLINNNKLTPSIFNKLEPHDKWDVAKVLKNVVWICKFCGIEQGKETPTCMYMGERYCSECDNILTYRTNGGQSDPFNYSFKKIRKRK